MSSKSELVRLTGELMEEPDVEYALKACRSLGIISAGREGWGIERFLRGDWEHQEGTSVIHLFPWGIEDEDDRPDKAWLIVDFESDGSHIVYCNRKDNEHGRITLSTGRVEADTYPKRWKEVTFHRNSINTHLRVDDQSEVYLVEYDDFNSCIHNVARTSEEGPGAVDNVLTVVRRSLGLETGMMPNRTDFRPDVLMNIMLDRGQPFDVPQMVASAHL